MAMVNMNNLLNGKDSRWLQLEVCREFQRNKCSRPDTECKFAHPPANVEVQNGRVTACYDSIKGRCNREKPPCKYFHPPQHLKDQLLINGRNHLALKNALMQQMGLTPGQPLVPGQVQAVEVDPPIDCLPLTFFPHLSMTIDEQYALTAANPYLTGMPQVGSTYSPYFAPGPIMPTIMGPDPTGVGSPLGVVPQTVVAQQKMPRSDRLEVCREYQRGACKRAESECRFAHPADSVTANEDGTVTVCMDAVKGRCNRDPCRYFHPPLHLQAQIKAAQSRASAPAAVSPLLAPPAATAALEIGKKRPREPSTADTDLLLMDMKSVGSFYYDNFAFPAGMVPYKRPAADKSGVPVYQPNATTYQQLMQLQQPFVPVSCEYSTSPAPPPSSSCASPTVPEAIQSVSSAAPQPQPQPPQQVSKDEAISCVTTTASLPSLPPQPAIPDPATLAKEVAQQNYAKAVKLAAVNQSLAANQFSHLNPLNYTGVALNKQALTVPPPTFPRYPALPFQLNAATSLNLGLANPYQAAIAQQNLLNISRPPPNFQFNPYSIMRTPYTAASTTPIYGNSILSAQYPVTVSAAPMTNVSASTNIAVAAAQNNNNNVVLQPYKKLKTT
ncbi:muscleblind-like protein 2a isoform X3 [Anoplophora glabripennis]|uniref:muscleblind-like protein 2a isoform X3 n=1 Tax=Anoplophora glabripennis TaxID=217634 RepID=UPI0008739BBD|nr:muscleblind-like protein 2a isoform X3 [Anoplophora glabripennis]